jgi:succinylglutamate desuccinylase
MEGLKEQIRHILFNKSRLIGKIEGDHTSPTVVFSGGIHGNEPAGVLALVKVFNRLKEKNIAVNGSILAIIGNRKALHINQRYIVNDLNRLWTPENIHKLHNGGFSKNNITPEIKEMIEIDELLMNFIKGKSAEKRYFIDLHTTSSNTIPFAAIDKIKNSIAFAMQLPLPFIINLDEFLKGTLLHYLDHINFGAMIFEAGTHEDPKSVYVHEALVWIALYTTGVIEKKDIPNYDSLITLLSGINQNPHQVFRIIHREPNNNGTFKMMPGFVNFQPIKRGQPLASYNGNGINSQKDGHIFMPLYQSQGLDGYFIVEKIESHKV